MSQLGVSLAIHAWPRNENLLVCYNIHLTGIILSLAVKGIPLSKVERIFPLDEGHIVEGTDRKVKNGFQLESKVRVYVIVV